MQTSEQEHKNKEEAAAQPEIYEPVNGKTALIIDQM